MEVRASLHRADSEVESHFLLVFAPFFTRACVEQRTKEDAPAEEPDVSTRLRFQRRHDLTRIVVEDADATVCGRWQGPREDDDIETRHGAVPALRGQNLVRLPSRSEERRVGKECRSRWSTCNRKI